VRKQGHERLASVLDFVGFGRKICVEARNGFFSVAEFASETLYQFRMPASLGQMLTNFGGIPLDIRWNSERLDVEMLTNRPDLLILLAAANDREGRKLDIRGDSEAPGNAPGALRLGTNEWVDVTIAIVPYVHVTYYVQPKLVPFSGEAQAPAAQSP
jgi:hypothetical protein